MDFHQARLSCLLDRRLLMEEKTGDNAEFDPTLYSSAELALMRKASGPTEELDVEPDLKSLQLQFSALARLVAEGGDRERQLRALISDLTLLAKTSAQQQHSIYEQTQLLAQIVLASSDREVKLQQNIEAVRIVVLGRAQQLM